MDRFSGYDGLKKKSANKQHKINKIGTVYTYNRTTRLKHQNYQNEKNLLQVPTYGTGYSLGYNSLVTKT